MIEKSPSQETKGEYIPTEDEVISVFEKLTDGKEYTEVRKREDGSGVYLWEIKLSEVDEDGGTTEYSYTRAGQYPENKSLETAIHIAFFDADGIPIGGHSVCRCLNGEWVETP
jgi:hypothetical protein